MNKNEALNHAVDLAGGQSALQRRLLDAGERISQQAIGLWLKAGQTAAGWALPVARAVEFQVTPHELDPVRYPNPWDGLPLELARPLIPEIFA
jgi:DNA-binding transcriptional regulator YdaS (Cro superfamily)